MRMLSVAGYAWNFCVQPLIIIMASEVQGCRRMMSDPCVHGIAAPLPVLLMYHPSMRSLAEKLVLAVPDQVSFG